MDSLKQKRSINADNISQIRDLCSEDKPPLKVNFSGRIVACTQQESSSGKLLTKIALFDREVEDMAEFQQLNQEVKSNHDFRSIAEHFFVVTFFGSIEEAMKERFEKFGTPVTITGVNTLSLHAGGPVGVGSVGNVKFE